jgi:competence protein CoiA
VLTARTDAISYVEAADAVRDGAYCCRDCGAQVVLKAGQIRVAHFAHKPDADCAFGAKMSLGHLTAQRRIAEALRARGVAAELEAFMASLAGDRRIDVLAWPADRPSVRIAIEVQASDMTPEWIAARTRSYNAEGVAPLWVRLLDFGAFERVQTLPHRATVWIDKYRARAWEHWAFDHLGGRLWFLDQGTFLAWRGTFVRTHSYREAASWYEPGGEEMSAGGDWRDIVQWVELELDGPFALSDLRLHRGSVTGPDNVQRLAAWFVAPGDASAAPAGPLVRATFKPEHRGLSRYLEAQIEGRWIAALVDGARSNWRTVRPPAQQVV